MSPQRFVHTRGQHKPAGSRICKRWSRLSNPYRVGKEATDNAEAVAMFREALFAGTLMTGDPRWRRLLTVEDVRRELAGIALLGCSCALGEPCHTDVLIEALAT